MPVCVSRAPVEGGDINCAGGIEQAARKSQTIAPVAKIGGDRMRRSREELSMITGWRLYRKCPKEKSHFSSMQFDWKSHIGGNNQRKYDTGDRDRVAEFLSDKTRAEAGILW